MKEDVNVLESMGQDLFSLPGRLGEHGAPRPTWTAQLSRSDGWGASGAALEASSRTSGRAVGPVFQKVILNLWVDDFTGYFFFIFISCL